METLLKWQVAPSVANSALNKLECHGRPVICLLGFFSRFKSTDDEDEKEAKKSESKSGLDLVKATFRHMKNSRYQQLLIPLTIWSGLEQGFFGADFTAVCLSTTAVT